VDDKKHRVAPVSAANGNPLIDTADVHSLQPFIPFVVTILRALAMIPAALSG